MKAVKKNQKKNVKNAKKVKKVNFWTFGKKLFSISFGVLSIAFIFIFLFSKNSNKQNAEKILTRAKELVAWLPNEQDAYALKEVFPSASIVPASFKKTGWKMDLEKGKSYSVVFILPKTDEDYKKSGCLPSAFMQTVSTSDPQMPVFVIINPSQLKELSMKGMKGINFDYLSSCMIHEFVHVYQRSVLARNGQAVPISAPEVIQREGEAYQFQSKFIGKILFDNKITNEITIPKLSLENQKQMTFSNLSNFCKEVDRLNKWQLGSLATLIVFREYPLMYASLANYQQVIK